VNGPRGWTRLCREGKWLVGWLVLALDGHFLTFVVVVGGVVGGGVVVVVVVVVDGGCC
jgi:hypothetical protein